ncbi:coiled-coil domain-containing protein 180-like isoform X4 [Mytilus galloprovincialis]|uniref:coiled-coil domain-containing protein 180-like isoform X4 n=1 Tax=Mytilus galloprovincialis TaxID=29158 RepID=UPI003F7C005D
MSETASARVVPSGKIYRQMFDAQLQLTQSLTKIKREDTQSSKALTRQSTGIPLVKLTRDEVSHGLLTERQRTWADGFPNEPYIENPALHKQYSEFIQATQKESEGSLFGKEVQGLPDVVVPAKMGSNIIDRIAASRKERHEAEVEDMHQELSVINSDIEPRIEKNCETLMNKLEENDEQIAEILERIKTDEDILTYTLDDLYVIWEEVQGHTYKRQEWIKFLDVQLSEIEDERMDRIRDVFLDYAKKLEKISHLMSPDLQRFMDQEAQVINQTMLSNRRAYSDLFVRLMSSDIEREKTQHTTWKRRVEDWRQLKTDLAIQKFIDYIQGDNIIDPPSVQKVMRQLAEDQNILSNKRKELVIQLRDLKPPASTKSAVYQWNKNIQMVSKEIDSTNQIFLTKLHEEYEKVCQDCLEQVDAIKKYMIEAGICGLLKAKHIVENKMLPLVGDRQRVYEENLETMEKNLDDHNTKTNDQLKSLFKYAQGSAHVWDVHEIGLAKQERALQEKLENCRQQHDNQNQDKEANLDIVMDKMRQDATEGALKVNLNKALEMLDKIKDAYEIFHQDETGIVKTYPNMVLQELEGYDLAVCKFFMVGRNPEDGQGRSEKVTKSPSKTKKGKSKETTNSEAITEILWTEKGTMFYISTESGEYGLTGDKSQTAAFLTEVESPRTQPDYIKNITVEVSLINETKKGIRLNFLNHLEEWTEQASERSESVVVSKCEELNSELDLRLHLHKPRSRRAEFDVHNVRAAELVMHSERVSRHTKGVQQALTDLKQEFTNMEEQHNKLTHKFREDIEALELVFINATKSSKLASLRMQLKEESEKFMTMIRTSLKNFRQHLDDTLQRLRESNARFIKSFKVFSDGGNFCPEEIREYCKKLDQSSQKIDKCEGAIMLELEGLESKRREQVTKVVVEFDDRFKHHMIDLVFMERIARWLTNTQVKIKAEVANSNSQAQQLAQYLNDVVRRIDACERPNLDKEQITSTQLNESLKLVFDSYHARSTFLNCTKDTITRPTSAMQGPPAIARVVFTGADSTPTPISKAGKQPTEDPSVGVIKSILKTQKTKMRFGMDADIDGETTPFGQQLEMREKMKSSLSVSTPTDKSKQKRGQNSGLPTDSPPKRVQSGMVPLQTIGMIVSVKAAIKPGLRRSSKSTKFDKKYLIFGEKDEEGEEYHLLGIIRRNLREALDGLLTSAELYYKNKGNRQVTRPQVLQETFELCADVVVQKLQSYFTQADEYHNQCLQEFRNQLIQLEEAVSHVPDLLLKDLLEAELNKSKDARDTVSEQFSVTLSQLHKKQNEHSTLLRPTLGHPHQKTGIASLGEKELERHNSYISAVEKQTKELQVVTLEQAKTFVEQLSRTAENQLVQYDNLLTVDDVEKGRVEPKKYPTSELIRRRNQGLPLEDDEDKNALPRGKNTWTGMPSNELVTEASAKPQLTASVTTAKTTLGHTATITARDKAYQEYKNKFEKTLEMIEEEKQKLLLAEQRWMDSWNTSVEKVKQLY